MIVIVIIILTAYLIYAYYKVGIPYCLSDTAYTVGKGIFASMMTVICALLWFPMLNVTGDGWLFLVFLSFAGIVMLAVSPYKDSNFNYHLHYIGTCITMVAVLCLWVVKGAWVVPIATILTGLVLRAITDKWLLWLELMMFTLAITYTIN